MVQNLSYNFQHLFPVALILISAYTWSYVCTCVFERCAVFD